MSTWQGPKTVPIPGRQDPQQDQEAYAALFSTLRVMGYVGRVSVEGQCANFLPDAKESFALLNSLRA